LPNIEISEKLYLILSFLPVFIISVTVHEFAHGYVAKLFGDNTAKNLGRLTLNPIKHIDLLGTIIMPLIAFASGFALIGWAKPIPVDRRNFKNPLKDDALVSFAGPFSNILLATFFIIILFFYLKFAGEPNSILLNILYTSVYLNIFLFAFNLLPIPPLDGSHILFDLFPNKITAAIINAGMYGFVILMLFIYSPFWKYFMNLTEKILTAFTFYI